MRRRERSLWAVVVMLAACGGRSKKIVDDGSSGVDAGESSGATGGTNGRGGTSRGGTGNDGSADGGTRATGGGTAGVNTGALGGTASGGTAGVVGAAGNVPAGGVAGVSTGGSATGGASGGVAGEAGSGSGGLACSTDMTPRMTFDFDAAGWGVTYSAASVSGVPLVDKASIVLGWTGRDGMPGLGALDISVPFSSFSQYVGIGVGLLQPLDLSATVVSLCIKVVSGLGDPVELQSSPGGARIYARSGAGLCYANGQYHAVGHSLSPVGQWMLISFNFLRPPDYEDTSCPEPFNPGDVRELGVQFDVSQSSHSARLTHYRIDTLSY